MWAVSGSGTEAILSLAESRSGEFWLGTYGNGILVVDISARAVMRPIRHEPLLPQTLDEDTLWSMYRDHAGDMWVGITRGSSRFDPNQSAILSLFGVVSRTNGISDGDVESVLPAPDGRVWFALGAKGVDILDPPTGRIESILSGIDSSGKKVELSEVRDLISATKGDVFLCTRTGLYRKELTSSVPVRLAMPRGANVRALALAPETGTLWVGSLNHGLWSLRLDVARNPPLSTTKPPVI